MPWRFLLGLCLLKRMVYGAGVKEGVPWHFLLGLCLLKRMVYGSPCNPVHPPSPHFPPRNRLPSLPPSRLEKHELMEFRRIASFIYKRNLKWRKAVALAKTDKLYKDAMETVAQVRGTVAFAFAMKSGRYLARL